MSAAPDTNEENSTESGTKGVFTNLLSILEGVQKIESKASKDIKDVYDVESAIYYGKVESYKKELVKMSTLITSALEWIDTKGYFVFDKELSNKLESIRKDLSLAKLLLENAFEEIATDVELNEMLIQKQSKASVAEQLNDMLSNRLYPSFIDEAVNKLMIIINTFDD